MDVKRRREMALGGVAVLLIAVAAWSLQRGPAPLSGTMPDAAARGVPAPAAPKSGIPEIDLSALEAERTEPDESTRDPFRFKPKPAPPAPMPSAAAIKQQQAAAAAEAATARPEPPPPPRIPL